MKINKTNDISLMFPKILIVGGPGSGKTYFLATGNPKETLLISIKSESGLMTLHNREIDYVEVEGLKDLQEVYSFIKTGTHKYKTIGIDSITQLQNTLIKSDLKAAQGYEKWNKVKELTFEVVHSLKLLPLNVIFTCETADEKDQATGEVKVYPKLMGSSQNDIAYWFDEVYYFKRWSEIDNQGVERIFYGCLTQSGDKYPCKSRIGILPRVIVNPNLNEIIAQLKNKKEKTNG
jgi:hypothetical protein